MFDSFEYPSSLPTGFDSGEEPSPETGIIKEIIVKLKSKDLSYTLKSRGFFSFFRLGD